MDDRLFQTMLTAGIKYLALRPRSITDTTQHLNRKLKKLNIEDQEREEIVTEVIDRLKEYGYLDDQRFAEQFAHGQVARRLVGKRRLTQELTQQKVKSETVREAVNEVYAEIPESDVMEQLLEKFIRSNGLPTSPQEINRLTNVLVRRGFSFELILPRLRQLARQAKLEAMSEALDTIQMNEE
ncbi:MAG: regulatory protein RecX [Acidobacteria bacterium]|nr:regulatory protein RecX [Acidobacteriota bacterium]